MSNYFSVEESNLVIKKEQVKNILIDIRNANKERNWERQELAEIKNIKTLFDFIGVDYEENEFEENYKIIPTSDIYEVYEFEEIMDIIAKYLDKNETYTMIINWFEYHEKSRWVFKNGKRENIVGEIIFEDEIEEKVAEKIENNKTLKTLKVGCGYECARVIALLEENGSLDSKDGLLENEFYINKDTVLNFVKMLKFNDYAFYMIEKDKGTVTKLDIHYTDFLVTCYKALKKNIKANTEKFEKYGYKLEVE